LLKISHFKVEITLTKRANTMNTKNTFVSFLVSSEMFIYKKNVSDKAKCYNLSLCGHFGKHFYAAFINWFA